ncbi:hypothetical protein ACAS46_002734 [Vibrio vulnificus]
MINQLLQGMKPPSANPYQVIPATQLLTQMRQMVGLEEAPKVPKNPFNTPVKRQSIQPTQDMWKPVASDYSKKSREDQKNKELGDKFANSSIVKSLGIDDSFYSALIEEINNPNTPYSEQDAKDYITQYVTEKIGGMSSKDFQGGF